MIKSTIFDCGRVFLHDPNNEVIFQYWAWACNLPYEPVAKAGFELIPPYQRGELDDAAFWEEFRKKTGMEALPMAQEQLWITPYLHRTVIDHDVLRIVEELKQQGYTTAVLSNTSPPAVKVNRQRGLFRNFDHEIFSCEVGSRKPEEKIYAVALEKTGCFAEDVVYIDDIAEYVAAANKMGMKGVHFQGAKQLKWALADVGVHLL